MLAIRAQAAAKGYLPTRNRHSIAVEGASPAPDVRTSGSRSRGGSLAQPPPLQRPPQLDEVGLAAKACARGFLVAPQAVAQRVGVDVEGARGVVDVEVVVVERAQC